MKSFLNRKKKVFKPMKKLRLSEIYVGRKKKINVTNHLSKFERSNEIGSKISEEYCLKNFNGNCQNFEEIINKRYIQGRKQNRKLDFDYSSEAIYFVTICTQNRVHYFGKN